MHPVLVRRRLDRRTHRGQPVRGAAHGRVGRRARRTTLGARAPPLAPVRRERREARLGWRSSRREARRARQPTPARPRSARPSTTSRRCGPISSVRTSPLIGSDDGLVVGLQLTHSGRWSRPTGASQPLIAYHHPVLDRRVAADATVLSDDDLDELVEAYVEAAVARGGRRLRLRRREALPRLPAPRAARRGRSAGRLRRVVRASDRVPPTGGRPHPGARPSPRGGRAPVGVRLRALRSRRGGRRRAGARRGRGRSLHVRWRRVRRRDRSHRDPPLPRAVPRARHRSRVHHRGEPVLQPARPTAGVLPSLRRLHPAGGSAGRQRPG